MRAGRKPKTANARAQVTQKTVNQIRLDNQKDADQCRRLLQDMPDDILQAVLMNSRYGGDGGRDIALKTQMDANEILDDRWLVEAVDAFGVSRRQMVDGHNRLRKKPSS